MLKDELHKNKTVAEDFRKTTIVEFGKTNSDVAALKQNFEKHIENYKSTFTNNEFHMDKTSGELRQFEKNLENLRAYLDGRVETMQFELSRRAKTDDLK